LLTEGQSVTEGYVPPIHDFTMEKDGSDFKENFLETQKQC
jgi:hypothetical protein